MIITRGGVKTKFARHLLLNDRKIDGLLCSCHADLSDYAKDYRQAVSGVRMTTLEKKLQRNYHSHTHTHQPSKRIFAELGTSPTMNSRRLGATHFRKNMLNLAPPPPIKKKTSSNDRVYLIHDKLFLIHVIQTLLILKKKVEQDFNRTMYNTL